MFFHWEVFSYEIKKSKHFDYHKTRTLSKLHHFQRIYLLKSNRGYILGVLMHTTTWFQLWTEEVMKL